MSSDLHTVSLIKGTSLSQSDRLIFGQRLGVANGAGGSAGEAVTVAVDIGGDLPPSYGVVVNPGQDATWFVSGKTASGFNVTLNPRLAENSIAAGTIDVQIFA